MTRAGSLWRADDVAQFFGISTRSVQRRVRDGSIPAVRLGGSIRFDPTAVAAAVGVDLVRGRWIIRLPSRRARSG